ncbi:HAD family hydrolase [Brachybacterium sacelli]|uniref:HAD superfamily hydrolase (TIGR01509 family) n=1 Tax=Brachybacterium sacelli TaxID=173364 RepID=A0ABS4X3L4_9MICO|nr:HAD family phosphatase [Brachybacterium sacelli]MBP2383027.1 HAD superfamily hydrolase (TIGR01509 family) [Brachybacterium sacelli]
MTPATAADGMATGTDGATAGRVPATGEDGAATHPAPCPDRFREVFGGWTPRAVVFDCDGLLLDTESVWQRAQDAVVAAHGAVLREEDDAALHGSTIEDAAAILAERSASSTEALLADLHVVFDRELAGGIRLLPGAREIVAAAGARVPLGCASNSWLESLEDKLRLGGLREHFTVLEASDTVDRPKPAPDMYAAAARALGAEPGEALALEDSGTGARAAREAGLRLVAVPAPGHPAPAADLVLGSLTDPDLAAWIATW